MKGDPPAFHLSKFLLKVKEESGRKKAKGEKAEKKTDGTLEIVGED